MLWKFALTSFARTIQEEAICHKFGRKQWPTASTSKTFFVIRAELKQPRFFPMIAETLQNEGFQFNEISKGENPVYSIKYAENAHPIIGFSKLLEDNFNPKSEFAAIMTCDSANESCPFVPGAEKRIPVTFEDPKAFDNTPQQAEKYGERSLQIASEMFYVFSQINA